jgi:hypothetical protein
VATPDAQIVPGIPPVMIPRHFMWLEKGAAAAASKVIMVLT